MENNCDDHDDLIVSENLQQDMIHKTNKLAEDYRTYCGGSGYTDSYSLSCLFIKLITGISPVCIDTDLIDLSDNKCLLKLTYFEQFYILLLLNLVRKDNLWQDSAQFPFWTYCPRLRDLVLKGLSINPTA